MFKLQSLHIMIYPPTELCSKIYKFFVLLVDIIVHVKISLALNNISIYITQSKRHDYRMLL